MRTVETTLGIIHERGSNELPLDDVYRQLFNPALYLHAYGKIYRNRGAMTRGATDETADGMSQRKIAAIIEALRNERYRWTPARRAYIEKKHATKKRPLGLPTWSDKLLQEVIREILEAYYEPQFSQRSHGFRPNRGCHTALMEVQRNWKGTVWFIEGDISQCFDRLDHTVLMSILREKILDNRFLRLIENLLKAGYLEDWRHHATFSGSPQGGIVSPILANIYLDRLDRYVEQTLVPLYTRGDRRRNNPEYHHLLEQRSCLKRTGDTEGAEQLLRCMRTLPSHDPNDPEYRRLRYIRYADDFLLGFAGPKHEAEAIKRQIGGFLREALRLELSEQKTLLTHARTEAARFLGYEVAVEHSNTKINHRRKQRSVNGIIGLHVPREIIEAKCQNYRGGTRPRPRIELINDSVYTIIAAYQQEFRGLAEYYQLAWNRSIRLGKLKWLMEWSLTATLASKLRISISEVYNRYRATIETGDGIYKGLEVRVERTGKPPLVAQWGGISLKRPSFRKRVVLDERPRRIYGSRTELVQRLLADTCELCGSTDNIEVHHTRGLRDLQRKGRADPPEWIKTMAARRRKTLVVCKSCHAAIEQHRSGR
jgi:group II intron reverse transcriptase/maturase